MTFSQQLPGSQLSQRSAAGKGCAQVGNAAARCQESVQQGQEGEMEEIASSPGSW